MVGARSAGATVKRVKREENPRRGEVSGKKEEKKEWLACNRWPSGKGQEGKRVPRSIYRPRKKGKPGKDGKQLNGVKTSRFWVGWGRR